MASVDEKEVEIGVSVVEYEALRKATKAFVRLLRGEMTHKELAAWKAELAERGQVAGVK